MSCGIDVSHNNGKIDWRAVKAGGIDFAIIRAGYGLTADRLFSANMSGAAAAGLTVGVYYFSYALNATKAAEEGAHCCSLIKQYNFSLPVYFDFEYASEEYGVKKGVTYTAALRTGIHKAFCERVRAGGYTPGIYSNADYITARLNWNELKGYKLWLAQWPYGADKNIAFGDVKKSSVKTTWGKPEIWQIGKGKVSGCSSDTDLNFGYMKLTVESVSASAGASASAALFKAGDTVRVTNTTASGGVKRGKTYGGGTFVVYYDTYDVISVSGKRIVIGRDGKVTAAVNTDDLRKV